MSELRCPVVITESGRCVLPMGHSQRDCVPPWAAAVNALEGLLDTASGMYEDWPTIDMEIGKTIDEARAALRRLRDDDQLDARPVVTHRDR